MVQKNVKLNLFVKRVKLNFSPCKLILFGSRAKGLAKKDSDYDIIIISSRFKNIEFSDRVMKIFKLKQGLGLPMDIICLTPGEFNERKKGLNIIAEASKEGVVIS